MDFSVTSACSLYYGFQQAFKRNLYCCQEAYGNFVALKEVFIIYIRTLLCTIRSATLNAKLTTNVRLNICPLIAGG